MVPDKFNMVDMGGIDLIMMQGEEVPGLYMRLVESIARCRYQCLYNWLFDGVIIPPTYVELRIGDEDEVIINEGVTVTDDDVIHIYSLVPPAPDPEIIPLLVQENGTYTVPPGKDGFNPVTVSVPSIAETVASLGSDVTITVTKGGDSKTGSFITFSEEETGVWYLDDIPIEIISGSYIALQRIYIETNYAESGFILSNWIWQDTDDFEIVFKMNQNPAQYGNWPGLIGTNNSSSADLFLQWNFYSGRRVINVAYNNSWAGDGTYSYDSPFDYDNYYEVSFKNGLFTIKKGASLEAIDTILVSNQYTLGQSTDTSQIKLFYALATSGRTDLNMYWLKVWRNNELIHHYISGEDSLVDLVDETSYNQTGTGITFNSTYEIIRY